MNGEIEHQKFATLSSYNPRSNGNILLTTCNTSFTDVKNGNQHIAKVNKTTHPILKIFTQALKKLFSLLNECPTRKLKNGTE